MRWHRPIGQIHQFVEAAPFANGISHHKRAVSLAFRQIMFRHEHHRPDAKTPRVAQVHLPSRFCDRVGARRNSNQIVRADLSLHREPDDLGLKLILSNNLVHRRRNLLPIYSDDKLPFSGPTSAGQFPSHSAIRQNNCQSIFLHSAQSNLAKYAQCGAPHNEQTHRSMKNKA
jgi:hypothetical protein